MALFNVTFCLMLQVSRRVVERGGGVEADS